MSTWIRKHVSGMRLQKLSPIHVPCPNTDLIKMFTKFFRVCCLSISPPQVLSSQGTGCFKNKSNYESCFSWKISR